MTPDEIKEAVTAQRYAYDHECGSFGELVTPEALQAMLEAVPRVWAAETIKDAPEWAESWWLFNSAVSRWQRYVGQRFEVIGVMAEYTKFTHATPILPPTQPPESELA